MNYTLNNFEKSNREFSYDLANILLKKEKPLLILCVGSNKIVWDSIGSITGQLLKQYYKVDITILGDMNFPITHKNIENTLNTIHTKYFDYNILIIDSTIATIENLYNINLNNHGLYIDSLSAKRYIGDISISSNTWLYGLHKFIITPTLEKQTVFRIANFIACGIFNALKIVNKIKNFEQKYSNYKKSKIS